jgi:hypothetical protein
MRINVMLRRILKVPVVSESDWKPQGHRNAKRIVLPSKYPGKCL